jgi:hypothetical protein
VARCLFPQYFAGGVATRLFPQQSLYDPLQIWNDFPKTRVCCNSGTFREIVLSIASMIPSSPSTVSSEQIQLVACGPLIGFARLAAVLRIAYPSDHFIPSLTKALTPATSPAKYIDDAHNI